jgi:phosphoglycerate dehydrogenase-like enzyme
MLRAAILDDYLDVITKSADWSQLDGQVATTVFTDHVTDPEALVARLLPFEIIIVTRERTPLPRSILERLSNLRLITTGGMNNRSIDVAAAHDLGIIVSGTESGGNSTGELAWGLMLSLARRFPQEDQATRAGQWQTLRLGVGLQDKTLSILGLGKIGARMAEIGRAFGMRVSAWSQNLTQERAAAAGATWVPKEELFKQADFLTIHLALSERTRGIVGAAELAVMKKTAFVVNTSRALLIDQPALHNALNANAIAGAGLDVFDIEPLPATHPIRALPNTIITPHLGYFCDDNYERAFGQNVEAILAYVAGTPIRVIAPPAAFAAGVRPA